MASAAGGLYLRALFGQTHHNLCKALPPAVDVAAAIAAAMGDAVAAAAYTATARLQQVRQQPRQHFNISGCIMQRRPRRQLQAKVSLQGTQVVLALTPLARQSAPGQRQRVQPPGGQGNRHERATCQFPVYKAAISTRHQPGIGRHG